MKILVLNAGSSSLKYQLIDMETEEKITSGYYERVGGKDSFLKYKVGNEKVKIEKSWRSIKSCNGTISKRKKCCTKKTR